MHVTGIGFSATVSNLQQKLESLQTSNTLMREDLNIAKTSIVELQQENSQLTSQTEQLQAHHSQQLQVQCVTGFSSCEYDMMLWLLAVVCMLPGDAR